LPQWKLSLWQVISITLHFENVTESIEMIKLKKLKKKNFGKGGYNCLPSTEMGRSVCVFIDDF
jgi:hypothetical protein